MAGTSTYPETIDNKTAIVDGTDYMEGDNVNHAYVPINKTQTFIGAAGKAQSWSTDLLDFLANAKAPMCVKKDANTITVKAGAIVIKKSDQSVRLLRKNTSDVDVVAGNLDTGSMADATVYYLYTVADSAATTFTVKFSLSATAPTGLTNFELIGWFYNEAAGSLTITRGLVGNNKSNGRDVPNCVTRISTTADTINDTSYGSDLTETQLKMVTSGRPVLFQATFETDAANYMDNNPRVILSIDSSDVTESEQWLCQIGAATNGAVFIYLKVDLAAGAHTFEWRMKVAGSDDRITKKKVMAIEL